MEKLPKTYLCTPLSGSARETALRLRNLFQGKRERPNCPLLILSGLILLLFGSLVSCQAQAAPAPPVTCPPEYQSYAALPGADVDGDGATDTVIAFSVWDESTIGTTTLQIRLSDGTLLEQQWEEGSPVALQTAPLLDRRQNAIVLERRIRGSNYDAAALSVFRVSDGKLEEVLAIDGSTEEALGLINVVSGSKAAVVDGTWTLRVPCLIDKWHSPEWHTFRWTETGWDHTADGFFIDQTPIAVSPERTLTLALRGRSSDQWGLVYDQIQIFDGETLIQVLTEKDIILDDRYLFEGLLAWGLYDKIQDVNFDGAEDFALLCGSTYNGPMCWFVWDETAGQFRHSFFSSLDLTLDQEKKQQIDAWRDGNIGTYYNIYTYDAQGIRILSSHYFMENLHTE